jgi:cytochrome c oxidase assembly protein subunit 15
VQFDHRLLATLTVLAVAMTLAAGFTTPRPARPTARLVFLGCAAALQYLLGVVTLLTVVPFDLATAHQAGAVLLLTAVLLLLHGVRRTRTR